MSLPDAELLDVVRRLRGYMTTMDNVHHMLNLAQEMDDPAVIKQAQSLQVDIPTINLRVAQTLRAIEGSRQYRDMVKKFHIAPEAEAEKDNG